MKNSRPVRPTEVFLSYAHEDWQLRDRMEKHLGTLIRQGMVSAWHDRLIDPGDEWAGQIDEHINSAELILLLVSANFLGSNYCYDIEMKRAMERHEVGEARVIPVILQPCDWQTAPFGKLQALPEGAKAVTLWTNRDEAFLSIIRGIRRIIKSEIVHQDAVLGDYQQGRTR